MIFMTTLEKRFPVACLALHLLSRGPLLLFGAIVWWASQGNGTLLIPPNYSVLQNNTFSTIHSISFNKAKIHGFQSK